MPVMREPRDIAHINRERRITRDGRRDRRAEDIPHGIPSLDLIRDAEERAEAVRGGESPGEEHDAEDGHDEDFDHEHPAQGVDGEEEEGELQDPEERKTQEVWGGDARAGGEAVSVPVPEGRPDGFDHAPDRVATDGTLDTHPDNTHDPSNHHRDPGPSHPERSAADDGEVEPVFAPDVRGATGGEDDEEVPDEAGEDREAGVEAQSDGAGGGFELGHVEAFGDPEAADVVPFPFLVGGGDGVEVLVAPAGGLAFGGKAAGGGVEDDAVAEGL